MKDPTMPEIVLVNTQIPENLGAVARAMLNFNLKNLRLVSPFFKLSNEKILPLAAGADSIIKNIKEFKSFEDSIKDFNILVATTNRSRAIKQKQISFKDLNKIIYKSSNKVAIIFGPEQSGLKNTHISICDFVLKINTNPNFSSLNLSHAVSIIAYEIMYSRKTEQKNEINAKKFIDIRATKNELMNFLSILIKLLDETGFFSVKERKKILTQKIYNIFNKIELTSREVSTLLGIIKSLKKNNEK